MPKRSPLVKKGMFWVDYGNVPSYHLSQSLYVAGKNEDVADRSRLGQ